MYNLYKVNEKYYITYAFKTKESSNSWLYVTIADFYLQTISFSMIVLYTEGIYNGLCWIIANCLLGSPISVLYLLTKNKWTLQK